MSKNITAAPVVTPATVNFHGHALTVITGPAGEHLVAMKPICDAIGLQWEAQRKRIQRHDVLKSVASVMEATAADGKRYEYTCLPIEMLNGWLFGVDSSRVRPEVRETLIQYQRECFGVLAAYWQQGEAVNPRKTRKPKALPGALTLEQQEAIRGAIKARIESLPHEKQGGAAIRCWSSLKSKFGCSYKEIPAEQFSEAVSLVARIELEGELLPKEEPKQGTVLDDHQLYDVWFVMHHFTALYEIFHRSNLYGHLTGLGSRIGVEMIDHFTDGFCAVRKLSRLGAEFDAAQRRIGLVHGRIG